MSTALAPLPVGFAKDLEGPTSDASPAGDVAFHALREYELGDDHRHIHWMSSARTGTLMVRHYVDNRRPNLTVVVDTEIDSYPLGAPVRHGDRDRRLARRVVDGQRPARRHVARRRGGHGPVPPGRRATPCSTASRWPRARPGTDVTDSALRALRTETGTSALVVVTGNVPTERFLRMATVARRSTRVVLVRVWPAGDRLPGALPGAKVVDVDDLDHFRAAWASAMMFIGDRSLLAPRWRRPIDGRMATSRRVAIVAAMSMVAAISFRSALSGWSFVTAAAIGVLGASAVVLFAHRRRLLLGESVALSAIAFLLLGGIAVGGVPTPAAYAAFARGLIDGWADLLSSAPPADITEQLRALPFAVAWLAAGDRRRDRPPLAPPRPAGDRPDPGPGPEPAVHRRGALAGARPGRRDPRRDVRPDRGRAALQPHARPPARPTSSTTRRRRPTGCG